MCEWGTNVLVFVKVAAELSHTGEDRWQDFDIDACIAPLVSALQAGGIDMLGSCCGHGKRPGEILLRDGRVLLVAADREEAERMVLSAARRDGGGE
jgi:hypothetical protein